ncbi:MAG: hypothetical protein EBZ75_15680, partial [Oxalobacteraceae bacterium]|nr:hypothetical protein [Oxalobacteraceae bacterium]
LYVVLEESAITSGARQIGYSQGFRARLVSLHDDVAGLGDCDVLGMLIWILQIHAPAVEDAARSETERAGSCNRI